MEQDSNYWQRMGKKRITRRRFITAAGATAAAASLIPIVGCGDDDSSTNTPAPSGASGSSTPAASPTATGTYWDQFPSSFQPSPASQIVRGGTFKWRGFSAAPHMDPLILNSGTVYSKVGIPGESLLRVKTGVGSNTVTPELEGAVASEWETPDDTTFLFTLQPGIKWHNLDPVGGRAVTTDDVLATFERIAADPGGYMKSRFGVINKVEAVGTNQVKFTMNKPSAAFLLRNAHPWATIMPTEILSNPDQLKTMFVGTGPFMLTQWNTGQTQTFEANPDYYRKDEAGGELPYLAKLEHEDGLSDSAAITAALRSGDINFLSSTNQANTIKDLLGTNPDLVVQGWVEFNTIGDFAMPLDVTPFKDVRVRRALNLAVDQSALQAASDGVPYKRGLFLPWSYIFDEAPGPNELGPYLGDVDLAQANQLLSAAGVTDLTIPFRYASTNPVDQRDIDLFVNMMAKINVTIEPVLMDLNEFVAFRFTTDTTEMIWPRVPSGILDPDDYLSQLRKDSPEQKWHLDDPELETILENISIELDPDKRKTLLKQAWDRQVDQVYFIGFPRVKNAIRAWYPTTHDAQDNAWYGHNYTPGRYYERMWVA